MPSAKQPPAASKPVISTKAPFHWHAPLKVEFQKRGLLLDGKQPREWGYTRKIGETTWGIRLYLAHSRCWCWLTSAGSVQEQWLHIGKGVHIMEDMDVHMYNLLIWKVGFTIARTKKWPK